MTERRTRVLLVHDGTPDTGHIKHLSDAGLDVSDASAAGGGALAAARTLQPDIIVLDFSIDGGTLQELKHNPATRNIPVIALVELLKQD